MRMTNSAFGARLMTMLVLAVALGGPLEAQESAASVEPVAEDAISKLRSPFCPGLMLEVCPTASAAALRRVWWPRSRRSASGTRHSSGA